MPCLICSQIREVHRISQTHINHKERLVQNAEALIKSSIHLLSSNMHAFDYINLNIRPMHQ